MCVSVSACISCMCVNVYTFSIDIIILLHKLVLLLLLCTQPLYTICLSHALPIFNNCIGYLCRFVLFLIFEPLFNRSHFTFMPMTHPRRSRNPLINMYVTFILKMAIHAFQSKATLTTTWSKQRVCFSQLSNCHICFVIIHFLSTNWF